MTSPRRPYAYPRGPISDRQERCLQKHNHFLLGDLVSKAIVPELVRRFVFNKDDADYVLRLSEESKNPQREQNVKLIETICKRSEEGFDAFLEALKATGHDTAYYKLKSTLDGAPQEMHLVLYDQNSDTSEYGYHDDRTSSLAKPKGVFYAKDLRNGKGRGTVSNSDSSDLVLKKSVRHQQLEIERLQAELRDAREDVERLRKLTREQDEELREQRKMTNHKAELLEEADTKISSLLEQIKCLEDENATLARDNKTKQDRIMRQEAKIADLEVTLADVKEENELKSTRINQVVKRLKDDSEELFRVSRPLTAGKKTKAATDTRAV